MRTAAAALKLRYERRWRKTLHRLAPPPQIYFYLDTRSSPGRLRYSRARYIHHTHRYIFILTHGPATGSQDTQPRWCRPPLGLEPGDAPGAPLQPRRDGVGHQRATRRHCEPTTRHSTQRDTKKVPLPGRPVGSGSQCTHSRSCTDISSCLAMTPSTRLLHFA
jgi:hypothetical protein